MEGATLQGRRSGRQKPRSGCYPSFSGAPHRKILYCFNATRYIFLIFIILFFFLPWKQEQLFFISHLSGLLLHYYAAEMERKGLNVSWPMAKRNDYHKRHLCFTNRMYCLFKLESLVAHNYRNKLKAKYEIKSLPRLWGSPKGADLYHIGWDIFPGDTAPPKSAKQRAPWLLIFWSLFFCNLCPLFYSLRSLHRCAPSALSSNAYSDCLHSSVIWELLQPSS